MLINFEQAIDPYKEIIELIHQFPRSTQFLQWIGKDDLILNIITETFNGVLYERVWECRLENLTIFSAGGQFNANWISGNFSNLLKSNKKFLYALIPELTKLEKKELSHTIEGKNYTVISQFYNQDALCGSCWEIYNLPNLLQAYKMRKMRQAL